MPIYTLSFDVSAVFSGAMPKLQIKYGGTKLDTTYIGSGTSTLSYQIDTDGPLEHSQLRFYFVDNYGTAGDTISFSNVRINDNPIDMSAFTHNRGSSGNGSTVTLTKGSYSDYEASAEIPETQPPYSAPQATISGDNGDNKIFGTESADIIDGLDGNDRIIARDGNDVVNGGNGNDVIAGQLGDDILNGDAGNDTIYGNEGNDTINGGANDDRLYGNEGVDTIHGDSGNDRLFGGDGDDFLYGDDGDDSISGEIGDDRLFGGLGNDQLFGGDGDDILNGDDGDDRLLGNNGNDTIYGGAGADNIDGQLGNDSVFGGDGNDTIDGEQGDDVLRGEAGDDTIMGGLGSDVISGGDGNDIIHGGGVSSYDQYVVRENSAWGRSGVYYSEATNSFYRYVSGGVDRATAEADAASSTLNGVAGHLVNITSATENDFLFNVYGLAGSETWIGGSDADVEGNWTFTSGNEAGTLFWQGDGSGTAQGPTYNNWRAGDPNDAGGAQDYAIFTTTGDWFDRGGGESHGYIIEWSGESVLSDTSANTLNGGNGNDLIYGGSGVDTIRGDADNDTLYGLDGNDIIFGDAGNDFLSGGNGNDALSGGIGNDILYGNSGNDTLNGGDGDDVLYALDTTVNRNASGVTVVAGGPITSRVTEFSADFTSNDGGFVYGDGNDPNFVDINGTRNTTDGNTANGSLQIFGDSQGGGTFNTAFGTWDQTFTFSQAMQNVEIQFSYRHFHDGRTETGEDSSVFYFLDGNFTEVNRAVGVNGNGANIDTGWVTTTISLGDVTAGSTFNFDLGFVHWSGNAANEDAFARFDDFTITGDVTTRSPDIYTAGNTTLDADSGSVNTVNGDAGADTIFGSSGQNALNGGSGNDTIYSGSVDTFTAQLSSILAANPNVSYNFETGNFYQIVATPGTNWAPANSAANAALLNGVNGHLATVTSATEHDFLKILAGGVNTWLGGTDTGTEGQWRWVTGPEAGQQFADATGTSVNGNYSVFTAGQPNDADGTQDYLYLLNGQDFADLSNIGNGSTGFVTIDQYAIEWEGSQVFASLSTNVINGGTGIDQLYGSDGIDIFYFDNTTSQDTIYNFNAVGRDAIDIGDIISYNRATDNIDNFVQLTEVGGNTIVAVDADGTGGFTNIATLNGVTGLNLDEAITANNIIVV